MRERFCFSCWEGLHQSLNAYYSCLQLSVALVRTCLSLPRSVHVTYTLAINTLAELALDSDTLAINTLAELALDLATPSLIPPTVAASTIPPTVAASTIRSALTLLHHTRPSHRLLHLPVLSGVLPSTDVELMDWMEDRLRHNTQVGAGNQRNNSGEQGGGGQVKVQLMRRGGKERRSDGQRRYWYACS